MTETGTRSTSPPSSAGIVSVLLYQGNPRTGASVPRGRGADRERRRRLRIGDLPALARPTDLRGADLRGLQSQPGLQRQQLPGHRTRRHEQGEHGGRREQPAGPWHPSLQSSLDDYTCAAAPGSPGTSLPSGLLARRAGRARFSWRTRRRYFGRSANAGALVPGPSCSAAQARLAVGLELVAAAPVSYSALLPHSADLNMLTIGPGPGALPPAIREEGALRLHRSARGSPGRGPRPARRQRKPAGALRPALRG